MKKSKSENKKCSCVESVIKSDELRDTLCKKCEDNLALSNKKIAALEKRVFIFTILFAIFATIAGKEIVDSAFETLESVDKIENIEQPKDSQTEKISPQASIETPATADHLNSTTLLSENLGVGLYDIGKRNEYVDIVFGNTSIPIHYNGYIQSDYRYKNNPYFQYFEKYSILQGNFINLGYYRSDDVLGSIDTKSIPNPATSLLFLFGATKLVSRAR